jgi:uncharacterized protein (DUF3820 family)
MDYHRKKYGCTVEELEQYQATSTTQPISSTIKKDIKQYHDDGRNDSVNYKSRSLTLKSIMPHGKYGGMSVKDTILKDVDYMVWFTQLSNISTDLAIKELIDDLMEDYK